MEFTYLIMPFRLPSSRINWTNSAFLIGTFVVTCTAVPLYLWKYGVDTFQVSMFLFFFIATGLSITLGYHRLFSHVAFQASWPVRLLTLIFGAAAFENSAMHWVSDHRRHHKHVDHADDPYDISQGFWYAHMGWILFKLDAEQPLDNIQDLRKDRIFMLQDKYYTAIAVGVGLVAPAVLGFLHSGWLGALGGFLLAGVARVTAVQHMTFFINSLCHTVGSQPYSDRCSARDSWIMAIFTFGEGYHNYHHEFQHDYRNGVKPWQWDPTKWTIWLLARVGLVKNLRTVPEEKILKAQIAEHERRLRKQLESHPEPDAIHSLLENARTRMHDAVVRWETLLTEYRAAKDSQEKLASSKLREMRRNVREASDQLRLSIREWIQTQRSVLDGGAMA